MSNIRGLHTGNIFPFLLVLEQVDPRRYMCDWLLGYLEDEMSEKIRGLILVKNNLLQKLRKFRKNKSLLGLIFPKLKELHKQEH
jgi:hypothetical protein